MKDMLHANHIWHRKIKYQLYTPEQCSSYDGERACCPHCKDEHGYHNIGRYVQTGFWQDVEVFLCQCGRCEKPFGVQKIHDHPFGAPAMVIFAPEELTITLIEPHQIDGEEDADDEAE